MAKLKDVCELMDKQFISLLELIEKDVANKVYLEKQMNSGNLLIAKTRYIKVRIGLYFNRTSLHALLLHYRDNKRSPLTSCRARTVPNSRPLAPWSGRAMATGAWKRSIRWTRTRAT